MSDFRRVTEAFWASPQISVADLEEARALGFAMVINNRPEGEADDQTPGAVVSEAAQAAGMDYRAIPIAPGGFSEAQVTEMSDALSAASGPVLAYCRSGTRSTLLWALAQAASGREPSAIRDDVASAGYDVGPIWPLLEHLRGR